MGARDDSRRLSRLRRRARALLWAERLLAAALPAALPLAAYLAIAAFGLADGWLCVASLLLAATQAARAAWRFRAPGAAEADRRIEAVSGLRHRPLAALDDRAALGDAGWFALHQARTAAVLKVARAGGPAPVAAAADPFALRAAAGLLLIAGIVIGGAAAPARLAQAFRLPAWPFPGPLVEAWVTPPAYTGQPPALLKPGQAVTVLSGAHLGVILSGSTARIAYAGDALAGPAPADGGRRAEGSITRSGRLTVGPWWHRIAAWDITAVPPAAPRLSLAAPTLQGADLQLAYDAEDAYGLASLAVAISPAGAPGALPSGAALPAQTGHASTVLNESESPYAGLTVAVTLQAANLAGITAVTPPHLVRLPPISLRDPTARALAGLRQSLALNPQAPVMAGVALGALSRQPPSAISYAADVQIAALAAALRGQEARPAEAVDRLAALIRQVEAGPAFGADQAVGAAARDLASTLANGGSEAELQEALQKLAAALAAKLRAGGAAPGAAGGQSVDLGDVQRMAEQIAADERAGNMDKARQELAQLQQTLRALQTARVMSPQEARRAQAAAAAQGALTKLIQGQGQELDKTGQGTATPGEEGQLRNALNALGQGLEKSGLSHIPGLGQAGQAMGQAQQGLSNGDEGRAASAEARAIAQMQQAAAALRNAAGTSVSFGSSAPATASDPNGTAEDDAIPGLDLDQSSPARKIQQEIMRRDAEPALSPGTHAYLHRLLTP
jgi:hypothetical protein